MQLATRQSPRFSTRAILAVLAIALWFAGTLGVMHRSLHVPGLPAAAAAVQVAQADKGVHVHAGHGVVGLFGDHTDAECRLYDQLSHGSSVPGVPLVVLPVLLPSATFAYLQGEAIARWVALFDARGPPSTR
ncbi:hypothetical protein J2W32_006133 [Variovorax boronicumulans]|uniref:DUF2946 domain-containing protein n=1 Tax=Variovorax boronicumulans TaxID=436515 RepID=A0AAW8DA81_9BURK|nr:hypothetical protein [Variovorax boronicumulans]MDP9897018.1 hypothetical protein [Variovorax boronicumulans]MDQ0057058.1 hypothetical protein [Variovorax boronicumulans]